MAPNGGERGQAVGRSFADGRTDSHRPARHAGGRARLLRSRRILPRRPRRHEQFPDRRDRVPAGSGRGDDGVDRGAPYRAAGHLLRDARPRRDQRGAWGPYRRARFRADDPVHRPGRSGDDGAGRVPGNGLSRLLRLDHEAGDADRVRRANSRNRPARVPRRDAGPARPGGDRAARRHADGNGRNARRAARRAGSDLAGPDPNGRIAEDAVGGGAADRHPRRGRMDQAGERRLRPVRRALRLARHRLVSPLERLRRRARQFRRRGRPTRSIPS